MASETRDVQAAPKVVLPAPARESVTTLAQQPVPVKILNPSSAPDPGWAVGGAIVGALIGAIVAQLISYRLTRRLRRRDERVSAFERTYVAGFAARRAVSRYRMSLDGKGHNPGASDAFVTALVEFRAAEISYRARFGDAAPGAAELTEAVEAVEGWGSVEYTDFHDDDAEERHRQALEEEAEVGGPDVMRMVQREDLRTHGQAMQDALERAAVAFGKQHR